MLNVSAEYLTAVRAKSRYQRVVGRLTLTNGTEIPLSETNIDGNSVAITSGCVSGEELEFGTAILSQLSFAIRTDQSRYVFYGATATLTYGIRLEDDTYYEIPLGVYTVAEAERNGPAIQITAYCNLLALDKDYDNQALYGTPYEILTEIAGICGVEFALTEDEVLAFPNGDQAIQIDNTTDCNTYRDCVRVVAQMLTAIVMADRNGAITLKRYAKEPVTTLEKGNRYNTTLADYVCRYAGVTIETNTTRYSSYDESVDGGLEMTMQAPAWDYGTKDTLQQRCDTVLAELSQIVYTPASMNIPGDPALECGDLVALTTDDGTVNILITEFTWRLHGQMAVESVGKNPYLHKINPKKSQIIRELTYQTTNNKLIFYSFTNTAALTVSGTEIVPLADVTFVTVEDTSAMFLAQLPVTVTVDDTVETVETASEHAVTVKNSAGAETTITDADGNPLTLTVVETDSYTKVTPGTVDLEIYYYLNGSLVDYELVDRLSAGPHILSLFYPFAELKGNANNNWAVRIRCGSGSVTVAKRGLRATVTGQGLAATTIWDGTITVEEMVAPVSIRSVMTVEPFAEKISAKTQTPTPAAFSEVFVGVTIRSQMTIAGFAEEIGVDPVWEEQVVSFVQLSVWTHNDRHVGVVENSVRLRTTWNYQSEEQEIDSGRMTVVKAVTGDLVSVESVEVNTDG